MADFEVTVRRGPFEETVDVTEGVQGRRPGQEFRLAFQIAAQVERRCVIQKARPGQIEGVLQDLGAVDDADGVVVLHQLVAEKFPVLGIVIDPVITWPIDFKYPNYQFVIKTNSFSNED